MVDILSALQWFNPVTSLLGKDLQDVHEFQVDDRTLRQEYLVKGMVISGDPHQ